MNEFELDLRSLSSASALASSSPFSSSLPLFAQGASKQTHRPGEWRGPFPGRQQCAMGLSPAVHLTDVVASRANEVLHFQKKMESARLFALL